VSLLLLLLLFLLLLLLLLLLHEVGFEAMFGRILVKSFWKIMPTLLYNFRKLGFYEWKEQKKEFCGLIFRGVYLLQSFFLFYLLCMRKFECWIFFNVSKFYEGFENVMFLLVLEVLVSFVGGEVIKPYKFFYQRLGGMIVENTLQLQSRKNLLCQPTKIKKCSNLIVVINK